MSSNIISHGTFKRLTLPGLRDCAGESASDLSCGSNPPRCTMTVKWLDDNDDWHHRQHIVKILENIVALDVGIIPCSVVKFLSMTKENTIDAALATMTHDEARKCRRKYRKLVRRFRKKDPLNKLKKAGIASSIFLEIREKAHTRYDKMKKANSAS